MPFELMEVSGRQAVIKVLGIGGGGGNAVDHIAQQTPSVNVCGQRMCAQPVQPLRFATNGCTCGNSSTITKSASFVWNIPTSGQDHHRLLPKSYKSRRK